MKEVKGQDRSTYLDNEFRQVFRNLDCAERIRKINFEALRERAVIEFQCDGKLSGTPKKRGN